MFSTELVRVTHDLHDDCLIFTMTLCSGQNQFSPASVNDYNGALDYVTKEVVSMARKNGVIQRAALVTTGEGKFYSTGLNLRDPSLAEDLPAFLSKMYLPLMGRFLEFPLIAVAAINGHAFAGGMTMAMCNDFRVMRSDRGFLCMNEIELPSPVPAGMAAVVRAKVASSNATRDIFLDAKRYSAQEAFDLGMIDKISSADTCLRDAINIAKKHARSVALMPVVQSIKRDMYPEAMELFEKPGSMKHVTEIIMKSKI